MNTRFGKGLSLPGGPFGIIHRETIVRYFLNPGLLTKFKKGQSRLGTRHISAFFAHAPGEGPSAVTIGDDPNMLGFTHFLSPQGYYVLTIKIHTYFLAGLTPIT